VLEETEELKEVFNSDNKDRIEDELGDLLFSVVNVARFCDCNAESALEKATQKFMRRYTAVERLAEEKGIDMKTSSIETLDKLWEFVKMLEK
jgi:tetrapyrrole methylase family protein/MazG family protein